MSYLLDTNVISEFQKKRPHPHVIKWLASVPDDAIYISVLTIGEIRKGIEKIEDLTRKEKFRIWLEHELPTWLQERVLPIDHAIADKWGWLQHQMKRPIPTIDSLLAATALHHDLYIVTRNSRDFDYPSLQVINPWEQTT